MRTLRFDRLRAGDTDLGHARGTEFLSRIRPPWLDLTLIRRLAAVGLAATAAVVALRGDPAGHRTPVVVAARDVQPGQVLVPADLRYADLPPDAVPEGAVTDPATVLGATSTGAVHAGEILTDLRIVGPRLAAAAAGTPNARIVPMRLADNAIADILRPGDRVDVVAAEDTGAHGDPEAIAPRERSPSAHTLATDAAVVLISGAADTGSRTRASPERIVLLALDPGHATTVAAASLHTALTVVFH
ncbi:MULTISPECIES: Flp pilus assembly protein CpaB [Nocardia]|uniref:Flp pilus assembly protein CpaB n=1 Tax=Nocardia TaxID=1817 RepID=UPI000A0462F4|nr:MULTISPECIES: Flp pilus assembly protein CpaB [Nocardia]